MSNSRLTDEQIKELLEHREVLRNIKVVLTTAEGRSFLKYLLKNFDFGEQPVLGLEGVQLADRIGFLRAGNSVFKLACEADYEITGKIVGEIEKEKYEALLSSLDGSS